MINKNSNQIVIAYLILVHRLPKQFKRLFKSIYHPDNIYLIHIDSKTSDEITDNVLEFLQHFPNTHVLESEHIIWGGFSMVRVELNGMKRLLELDQHWDYFINLSGQDFPLKSQKLIRKYLTQYSGSNFIKVADQFSIRPETMNRINHYFIETSSGFITKPNTRGYLKDVTPYIGGQWMILTRACCMFICYSKEIQKFESYYLNTLIADESFFQTVLMNTSFDGKIINDDKRAIIWVADGDIKLRPKTFTKEDAVYLAESNSLFARKFDDHIDDDIINTLMIDFNSELTYEQGVKNSLINSIGVNNIAIATNGIKS